MKNVLRIETSIFGANGNSHALTENIIENLREQHGELKITTRDFSKEAIPHFDASVIASLGEGQETIGDRYIEEAENADIIVIAAPMYNFSISSQLKAWLDHISRAKRTFQYTENGPEGLLKGKQVYIATTRGGMYKDTVKDTMIPYLKVILGFLGLDESLEFVFAEGLAMSDKKEAAMDQAKNEIRKIIENQEAA